MTLLEALEADIQLTVGKIVELEGQLLTAERQCDKDELMIEVWRQQKELRTFASELFQERAYQEKSNRDPFEVPKDPWACEQYPSGKI